MAENQDYTIRVKRGTANEWAIYNPILGAGELGYDTTNKRLKVGDGLNVWSNVKFATGNSFDVARDAGFDGTLSEWLESLREGPANTLSVGNVTVGGTPTASIRGDAPNQIIDFVFPGPSDPISYNKATPTSDGLMAKEDKVKVDNSTSKTYVDNSISTLGSQVSNQIDQVSTKINNVKLVRKLYDGTQYPAREENVTNVFVGPVSPGSAMNTDEDIWTTSNSVLVDTIISEVNNQNSNLNKAIKNNFRDSIFIKASEFGLIDNRQPSLGTLSPSSGMIAGVPVWLFDDTAVEVVGSLVSIPSGWSTVSIQVIWSHDKTNSAGDVTWIVQINPFDVGVDLSTSGSNIIASSTAPTAKIVTETVISNSITVPSTDSGVIRVGVARQGNGTGDTFTGDAGLIGVLVERVG